MIDLDIAVNAGSFNLEARFANEGGVTAIFGPSGSGKTTLINAIAGLITPRAGTIRLNGEVLFDSTRAIDVPPHKRRIGYVFQDARLFPHLNVRRNLDFGRRMNGLDFDAGAFAHLADMLDIAHLLDRAPARLSGGERQRIALGRALMAQPRLLLLDEPLASLDAGRKADILPYLIRLRDEFAIAMIYVSHDRDEARRIATDVVRLDNGRILARGGPDMLAAPIA